MTGNQRIAKAHPDRSNCRPDLATRRARRLAKRFGLPPKMAALLRELEKARERGWWITIAALAHLADCSIRHTRRVQGEGGSIHTVHRLDEGDHYIRAHSDISRPGQGTYGGNCRRRGVRRGRRSKSTGEVGSHRITGVIDDGDGNRDGMEGVVGQVSIGIEDRTQPVGGYGCCAGNRNLDALVYDRHRNASSRDGQLVALCAVHLPIEMAAGLYC